MLFPNEITNIAIGSVGFQHVWCALVVVSFSSYLMAMTVPYKAGRQLLLAPLRVRILVQVTIYRTLRIGRDGNLDQSDAYDIS